MTKNRDFRPQHNVFFGDFQHVANLSNVLRSKRAQLAATLADVLQYRSVALSVAAKIIPTQWLGGLRNSATLLSSKINNSTYVHTYTHAYRGNIGTHFEMLRAAQVASGCFCNRAPVWANLGVVA